MYYEVIKVTCIEGYKLEITFRNGKTGIVDFQKFAQQGGVFTRFLDLKYFQQFYINQELGVLCWPDEVDIAPETLYSEATEEPLPEWMTPDSDEPIKEAVKTENQ